MRGMPLAVLIILGALLTGCQDSSTDRDIHTQTATPISTATPIPSQTVSLTPASPSEPTPSPAATAAKTGSLARMGIKRVFPKLAFPRMVRLAYHEEDNSRLFVVLQQGKIMAFENNPDVDSAATFLDITDRVNRGGNEEGLLGLAFDPSFTSNGYFYVYYSAIDPRRTVLSRFSIATHDPIVADPGTERIILEVPQPSNLHNGGQIVFGSDGYLYVGLGDGGVSGKTAQDLTSLLGSLLRIDVSTLDEKGGYSIPPDNPFVSAGEGVREEIWAYGLRNPWRFAFDRATGDLWVGDVGEDKFEEVDIIKPGLNYGWPVMEGGHCFNDPDEQCDRTGLTMPVVDYSHETGGCAIIGGHVYRGANLPSLYGAYVYGDACTGKVWAVRYDGSGTTEHIEIVRVDDFADTQGKLRISSFGEDQDGEIYILSFDEKIYRLFDLEDVLTPLAKDSPWTGHWTGFRAEGTRSEDVAVSGIEVEATVADVHFQDEKWSGIVFVAFGGNSPRPKAFDWTGVQVISTHVRWSTAVQLQQFRLALEDTKGKRWAWTRELGETEFVDGGWQVWNVTRSEATRKDAGFAWDKIANVRITAFPVADSVGFTGTVEVGPVKTTSS